MGTCQTFQISVSQSVETFCSRGKDFFVILIPIADSVPFVSNPILHVHNFEGFPMTKAIKTVVIIVRLQAIVIKSLVGKKCLPSGLVADRGQCDNINSFRDTPSIP